MSRVNSTTTLYFDTVVNLDLLGESVKRFPKFPGAKMKRRNFTVLIFKSGKAVVIGCRSNDAVLEAIEAVQKLFADKGIPAELKSFKTSNIVLCYTHPCTIDIQRFQIFLGTQPQIGRAIYNGSYPAVRVKRGKSTRCMVYSSGKVITVAPSEDEAFAYLGEVREQLNSDKFLRGPSTEEMLAELRK